MSNLSRRSEKDNPGQKDELASSPGIQSASVTPQDVAPEDAAARDLIERAIHSDDLETRAQALLDEAIEETFPASDPIAVTTFEEALEIMKAQKAREDAATPGARR